MQKNLFDKAADNARILVASMVEKAKSGHPGGSMGGCDFVNVLYSKYIVEDPNDPQWIGRDRFFLDPGHMSPMLYSILHFTGKYSLDDLKAFRQWGSCTSGHPELDVAHGIENTSGPLGQGHAMAVGCAIAERYLVSRFGEAWAHKTFAFISDGGIQEGISQGAGRIAGYLGLNNLIMFYDSNAVQLSTDTCEVTSEDTAAKYRAWNWNVLTINGNNAEEICKAIESALTEKERPTLIIGNTVMGKGCVTADGANFEGKCSTHGQPLSKSGASYEKTVENLGGTMDDPWTVFAETRELYAKREERLKDAVAERRAAQEEWKKANPELAEKLQGFIDCKLPEIDYKAIPHKPNVATRTASADVLGVLGEKCGNMIVSSADLANSDKTDAFLKKVGSLKPHDFSGGFLHAGVEELTMAAVMNGVVLHGGMHAACGTFFVFSDYMKPVVRLAALMQVPVKYVWTHDAFRVGEDGPTHQPIEQEAQLRLLEEIKNFKGKNSVLVLRPADSAETTVAWKMAMENQDTPTGLILSRQDVPDLPTQSGDRYADAQGLAHGAYVLWKAENPEVVLVGSGSEVSTLVAANEILKERGVRTQIVSAPSTGLFFDESKEYRESVIPSALPKYALTAGLPSSMMRLVGPEGYVHGLNHFGSSAPYKVLDEKFGFTAQAVADEVCKFLGK